MRILRTIQGLRRWRRGVALQKARVGLVPTMGALHQGHQALIQRARRSCDTVVVSLFVNPLQFGPKEDFKQYPRSFQADIALCRKEGVDILFLPTETALYPQGFQTSVIVHHLAKRWEGEQRPTHFQGVATVITKLFNLVSPNVAFLGQKDYQQTLLIRQVVQDLHLAVTIIMCPTVREIDGLACSSRNEYLTTEQREKAVLLYHALKTGQHAIKTGMRKAAHIRQAMFTTLKKDQVLSVDYLSICDASTLEPIQSIKGKIVFLGAIHVGSIRLLDNILVTIATSPRR